MSWTLLAAVHKTETSFGRGPVSSSAGAQGPMQLMLETFASYGRNVGGDGVTRVDDLEDAIYSAANLDNPRIVLTELARSDIEAGVIDQRVLAVMEALSSRFEFSVSVLKSGHSPQVAGKTSYSNHYFGRAVDIYAVNGQLVSRLNAASRELTMWLGQFPVEVRPSEVGSPFGDIVYPGAFSDLYHRDHVT